MQKVEKSLNTVIFLSLLIISYISACKKEDNGQPQPTRDAGTFIGTLEGEAWKPMNHRAIYYKKWQQIYFEAFDETSSVFWGIMLDTMNPLKLYNFEPHGSNVADIGYKGFLFSTDYNNAGAGGNFTLTKFDTLQKTVSGKINATGYGNGSKQKVTLSAAEFKDIPLYLDTTNFYYGSIATSTVTGVTTTQWMTKDIEARVDCIHNFTSQFIELVIHSIITQSNQSFRSIVLKVPLALGTYQVYDDVPPYSYCGNMSVTARYGSKFFRSIPTAGSFTINKLDTLKRTFTARFDITFKDTARQETIRISNGNLQLAHWRRFGE